jgi:hypothetical protein
MSYPTIISEYLAVQSARKLPSAHWAFRGVFEIPFCHSSKALRNEFRRFMEEVCHSTFGGQLEMHWVLNILAGEEFINDDGYLVQSNARLHFLLSDVLDSDQKPMLRVRDRIYHQVHALWRYEVLDFSRIVEGEVNFDEALELPTSSHPYRSGSSVGVSASLFKFLLCSTEESAEIPL